MSTRSCIFAISNKNNMENLVKKFKKQGTLALVKKQGSATGEDLTAIEIILVSRNQPFKAKSDIKILSDYSGVSEPDLKERGYYEIKKTRQKAAKKSPLALNEGERHFLEVLIAIIQGGNTPYVLLSDLDPKIVPNGARYAGIVKSLLNRELIGSEFKPSFETKKVESTMWLTEKGREAFELKEKAKFKRVKKVFKEIDEEDMEELELESLRIKKQMINKFVSFQSNVEKHNLVGLVTGTKIDKRTGYIYLNIRIGKKRFNKRPDSADLQIEEEVPNWFKSEKEYKVRSANVKKKDQIPQNSLNTTNDDNN